MLSFVVHNFTFLSPILRRTQKLLILNLNLQNPFIISFFHLALAFTHKSSYTPLSSSSLISSYYYFYFFINKIWRVPTKLFLTTTGLYTNNLTKSLIFRGLKAYSGFYRLGSAKDHSTRTLHPKHILNYTSPRILLHFALLKSSFKVISLFFLQYLFYNYPSMQTDFRPYANYFILANWAYFYSPINSFYFRTYYY